MKKKIKIWSLEIMLIIMLAMWVIITLTVFNVLKLGGPFDSLTTSFNTLTGFKYLGGIFILGGIGFIVLYTSIMIWLYYWQLNKNAIFWSNILMYSLPIALIIIGGIMLVVNF